MVDGTSVRVACIVVVANYVLTVFTYIVRWRQFLTFYSAAALLAMQSAVIPTVIPSVHQCVCQSVCPSICHAMQTNKGGSCSLYCEVAKTLSFLIPTMIAGRRPLPPKICAQSDPPPLKSADFDQIFAYNVSTVRASEKSSIIANRKSATRFPTSYRPLSPPKVAQKVNLSLL